MIIQYKWLRIILYIICFHIAFSFLWKKYDNIKNVLQQILKFWSNIFKDALNILDIYKKWFNFKKVCGS